MREQESADPHRVGDKIRVRRGQHQGGRGVVHSINATTLAVQLDSGELIHLSSEALTNFSRAARRAWEAAPKRSGRPKAKSPQKKMVSLRIETVLWDKLGLAVEQGLLTSREQAINDWVRGNLDHLFGLTDTLE